MRIAKLLGVSAVLLLAVMLMASYTIGAGLELCIEAIVQHEVNWGVWERITAGWPVVITVFLTKYL